MFKKYKEKFIGDREFYANLIRLIIPMIVRKASQALSACSITSWSAASAPNP